LTFRFFFSLIILEIDLQAKLDMKRKIVTNADMTCMIEYFEHVVKAFLVQSVAISDNRSSSLLLITK
jgi:hypothetical protein